MSAVTQVDGGEGHDPDSASAFAAAVEAAGVDLHSCVENSIGNLIDRGVRGEPIICLIRVRVAITELVASAEAARGYFENHRQIQNAVLADPTVGGARYLGLGGGAGSVLSAPRPAGTAEAPEPEDAGAEEELDCDGDEDHDAGEGEDPFEDCTACGKPLDEAVIRVEDAVHAPCDPDAPAVAWWGLPTGSDEVVKAKGERYRTLEELAGDLIDEASYDRLARGDLIVLFADGTRVDAREWAERPETAALAGGGISPPRRLVVSKECEGCSATLVDELQVRGELGQIVTVHRALLCYDCKGARSRNLLQYVQGTAVIADTDTLEFQRAESWSDCLGCGGSLGVPTDWVELAYCKSCKPEANKCYLGPPRGHARGERPTIVRERSVVYASLGDLALDLREAVDRGEIEVGDLLVDLPEWNGRPVDARTWVEQAQIREALDAQADSVERPGLLQPAMEDGRLRPRGRR